MIRLIAIDLDDTLLNKQKEISLADRNSIQKAKLKGIKIVIASGRPFFRIKPILEILGLNQCSDYVIAFNGGLLTNGVNTTILQENILDYQSLQHIYSVLRKYDFCFTIYQNNLIYTSKLNDEIRKLPVYKGIHFVYLNEEEMDTIEYAHKVILADFDYKIEKYKDLIVTNLGSEFSIVRTTPNFLEILPKETSKGNALRKIKAIMGIRTEEIMVIGDAENDVSMFSEAAVSVAMENAIALLKENATFITKSCEESGVSYAISKFMNEEKENE